MAKINCIHAGYDNKCHKVDDITGIKPIGCNCEGMCIANKRRNPCQVCTDYEPITVCYSEDCGICMKSVYFVNRKEKSRYA